MYIDAHSHPQFLAYGEEKKSMLARAKDAGVKIVAVGTQRSMSEGALQLAKENPGEIWATVGFHPNHALPLEADGKISEFWYHDKHEQEIAEPEKFDSNYFEKLAGEKEVVAIGECGLDYFRLKPENRDLQIESQKKVFSAQIEIAKKVSKPLMIHCRDAFGDLIEILKDHSELKPGIVHFFTGSKEDAQKLLDLGYSFTFGGVITFSRDYDEVIKMIPIDRILSETDAPYVAPEPYRGKRNEPAYVVEVAKKLAEIKEVSLDKIKQSIYENANRILGLT